jgi:hypothetical protein
MTLPGARADRASPPRPPFTPTADVACILNALLDAYERHAPGQPFTRAIRVRLDALELLAYRSQLDPAPRETTNRQCLALEAAGWLRLAWQPGEEGHLLEAITLSPEHAPWLFDWLGRPPLASQRAALRDLLLAYRFRFADDDWRAVAVEHTLAQLRASKSPAPFALDTPDFNRNLLDALVALDQITEETPYRVFSVRTFNDSKLFESVRSELATLARRHGPGWDELTAQEALAELGLTPNPTHVYLYGPWHIEDMAGRSISLADFYPAAGVPALMLAAAHRVSVDTARLKRVVCVENLASFYELIRYEGEGLAAVCLWGNPSPAVRHLLACLTETLPPAIPLQAWTDLDFGGFRIVSALRRFVAPRFLPYRMDSATLDAHRHWARPLAGHDAANLTRLLGHAELSDLRPTIEHMLEIGLKLEQEAIQLGQ